MFGKHAAQSGMEKAAALKKRKILWESLREQQAPGGNLVPTRRNDDGTFQKGDEKEKGFAASTAEIKSGNLVSTLTGRGHTGFASSTAAVTGMSKQAINEYVRIAPSRSPPQARLTRPLR